PPPPISTLFPYTTLFRSREASGIWQIQNDRMPDATIRLRCRLERQRRALARLAGHERYQHHAATEGSHFTDPSNRVGCLMLVARSEEHTSELQSRENLVC